MIGISGSGTREMAYVITSKLADHLPLYGYAHDTAPFLSELARDGIVFERAYSTSSWTAPASLQSKPTSLPMLITAWMSFGKHEPP